jgi:hypothetical protein
MFITTNLTYFHHSTIPNYKYISLIMNAIIKIVLCQKIQKMAQIKITLQVSVVAK